MRIFKNLMLAAMVVIAAPAMSAAAPQPALPAAPQTELAPAPGAAAVPAADPAQGADPAAAVPADDFQYAAPTPGIGQPDGRYWLQDQVSQVGQRAANFHDYLLMPIITVISLFVLGLLLWVIVRYNRRSNPEPSKTTHNTVLEVVWTLVPVLILVVIAVPSIGLLQAQYNLPEGETVTVKVTGNQWYWTYEYPDYGEVTIVSNMLAEQGEQAEGAAYRTDADGPRLLAVDNRVLIPAGVNIRFLVTASDVIHSFAVPAFWTKIDAVPGRLNEGWVRVDRPGVYYGQCSELCGARHSLMPIAVEVVSRAEFDAWIQAKGGTLPGSAPAEAEEAAAPAANDNNAGPDDADTVPGTTEGPVTSQAATVYS